MGTKQFDNYADLITFTRASGATYLDSDGVLKTASTNIPRIEYDADGNRLGLLVEEQRTNLLERSEEFDNAYWSKTIGANLSTINANSIVAPDGTLTGDKIVTSISFATHGVLKTGITTVSGNNYTTSIYAKAGEWSRIGIRAGQSALSHRATVDLTDGSKVDNTAGTLAVKNVGNGWYKISISGVVNTTVYQLVIEAHDTGVVQSSEQGDGTSGIYIWGAQLEEGAFPTSYIPTSGSTATRAADVASITGADFKKWFNPAEGSVIVEAQNYSGNTTDPKLSTISDGTSNNRIRMDIDDGNKFRISVVASGNVEVNQSVSFTGYASFYKAVMAYAVNDFKGYIDGGYELTDTSGTIPLVDRLFIGADYGGTAGFTNGHIKSIKYYPRRLSNAQLQELTQ